MATYEYKEQTVVECAHCNGTGTCKNGNFAGHVVSCDACKSKAKQNGNLAIVPCSVCEGKGKVKI